MSKVHATEAGGFVFPRNVINRICSIISILMLLLAPSSYAQSDPPTCGAYAFGYFNGVMTTYATAQASLEALSVTYGTQAPDGRRVNYYLFYNRTANAQDFVETFEQRVAEQQTVLNGRYEFFWESLRGSGRLTDRLGQALSSVPRIISDFAAKDISSLIAKVAGRLAGKPPTVAEYQKFKDAVDQLIQNKQRMLFYAHSQGNLFANVIYDYAESKSSPKSVALVHVAPASPTIRGFASLADLDLVINALRTTGTVAVPISDTTPIPNYFSRAPGLNGEKDVLGHGLLEIYLNDSLPMAKYIKTAVNSSFAILSISNQSQGSNICRGYIGNYWVVQTKEVTFNRGPKECPYDAYTGRYSVRDNGFGPYFFKNPISVYLSGSPSTGLSGMGSGKFSGGSGLVEEAISVSISPSLQVKGTLDFTVKDPTGLICSGTSTLTGAAE